MGEEGFSSDSSLLYHRGVPSAIVASEVWELPDQTPHAQPPAQAAPPQAARPPTTGKDAVERPPAGAGQQRRPDLLRRHRGRPLAVLPQRDRRRVRLRRGRRRHRRDGVRRACPTAPATTSSIPRATTHRWVPAEPSRLYADRGQQPHRARRSATCRATASSSSTRRTASATCTGPTEPFLARGRATSRCWSSTAPARASSAPG